MLPLAYIPGEYIQFEAWCRPSKIFLVNCYEIPSGGQALDR